MLSAALGASDPAEPIVEEDAEPDHTADAHDILDEMLKDSSSSEGNWQRQLIDWNLWI